MALAVASTAWAEPDADAARLYRAGEYRQAADAYAQASERLRARRRTR